MSYQLIRSCFTQINPISSKNSLLKLIPTKFFPKRSNTDCKSDFGKSRTVSELIRPDKWDEFDPATIPTVQEFSDVYPDFMPSPRYEHRNRLREQMEREDMVARRNFIDIPEFYVGSIMAVTISDPNASGKTNRFVGMCTERGEHGIRSWFNLRNVIDETGIEIKYEMYCPLLLSIEVLKLEKRLDSTLMYLRDCLPEYSTIPLDMDAEPLADGLPVPVNETQAKLKPPPWMLKWERFTEFRNLEPPRVPVKLKMLADRVAAPWEKYDLMKQYRSTIPMEEKHNIYLELVQHLPKWEAVRRKVKKIRVSKERFRR